MPIAVLAGALSHYIGDGHPAAEGAVVGVGATKVLGDLFK